MLSWFYIVLIGLSLGSSNAQNEKLERVVLAKAVLSQSPASTMPVPTVGRSENVFVERPPLSEVEQP